MNHLKGSFKKKEKRLLYNKKSFEKTEMDYQEKFGDTWEDFRDEWKTCLENDVLFSSFLCYTHNENGEKET